MQIDLNPEAVQQAIVAAIVDSSVGAAIKAAINERLSGYQFKEAVGKVVDQQIAVVIRNLLLEDDAQSKLKASVREILTEDTIRQVVVRVTEKIWN